jgi:hypothetical protein
MEFEAAIPEKNTQANNVTNELQKILVLQMNKW